MAKEAYIEIDGKRTPLTIGQMKALGIYEEIKKSPFDMVEKGEYYYFINSCGKLENTKDFYWESDYEKHEIANYCADKEILQHRALHETLNRLLWRFSMENEGDKIDWKSEKSSRKWYIYFDEDCGCYKIDFNMCLHYEGTIYFHTKEIAQKAIDEIVRPFMRRNPDFIW